MPIIKPVGAFEDETIEIRWHLRDGSTYYERHTLPPEATVKERQRKEQEQQAAARQPLFEKVDAAFPPK